MPINRSPFNALVDDTGNGLTGSIWNKAAIQSVLLDPIDQVIPSGWVGRGFTPANYTADVGTWTVTAAAFIYAYIGAYTYAIHLYFESTIAGNPNLLKVALPVTPTQNCLGHYNCVVGGSWELGATLCNGGQPILFIRRSTTTPFAAGPCLGNATIIIPIG